MKTIELKRLNDQRIFKIEIIYRKSEKYCYSGLYYKHNLKLKVLKAMIELSRKRREQKILEN
jgi:hypothetical protein